jgi:transcriptional regulator with XRE-family HTH domain
MLKLNSSAIKALRTQKGMSHKALSDKANISRSNLIELEKPANTLHSVHETTYEKLKRALGATDPQMRGDDPVTDPLPVTHVTLRSKITTVAQMNYDLVNKKYGVNSDQLAQLAPLMFAILVEDSFAWRQEQLELRKRASDLASQLSETQYEIIDTEYESPRAEIENECILKEAEAIDAREVFTKRWAYGFWASEGTYVSDRFTDFIASKVRKTGSNLRADLHINQNNSMDHRDILATKTKYIAVSDIYQDITGADDDHTKAALAFALLSGLARLHDAPTDVQTTEALREWVIKQWLASGDDPTTQQLWANIIQRQDSFQINNPEVGLDEDGFPTVFKPHPLSTSQATAEGEVK